MPIYEYRCDNGHNFEVMQRMVDDPVTTCTTCDASVQRVFHPVAVHFKGSGFYTTDYGKKRTGPASGDSSSKDESTSSSESKTSKGSDSKSAGEKSSESSSTGSSSGSSSD